MEVGSPEIVPVNSPASNPDPESPEREGGGDRDRDGAPPAPPEPLSEKLPVPAAELSLYRAAVALRVALLGAFFRYRFAHPARDPRWLWAAALACELWLAVAWLLAQLPRLSPTNRAARLDGLQEAGPLPGVDVLVTAAGAGTEAPLATANAVLSVLAADYPAGSLACYVHDDGADMLVFEALFEAAGFARRWVPFCRRHAVEPRAPELYFARGVDYLRDRAAPSFVKERRAMKVADDRLEQQRGLTTGPADRGLAVVLQREYEEFKVRMNYLAAKARKVPEDGWVMSDGTPWPGNNPRDHPAMIQVLLGHPGDQDAAGNQLPRLFYVSREKRPGFQHHSKAGALNALLRVSALLTNGAYVLNLHHDHCVTNSCVLREAMCFLTDPVAGNRTCFVQFPLRIGVDDDGGEPHATRNSVFFDSSNSRFCDAGVEGVQIDMKCMDGIQGPPYVGSGCCFNRKALYGFDPAFSEDDDDEAPAHWSRWCFGKAKERALRRTMSAVPLLDSEDTDEQTQAGRRRRLRSYRAALERHFGHSPAFIASAFTGQGRGGGGDGGASTAADASSLLREAIHVVSCAYEERTRWGKDVGWVYGSGVVVTGFRMHARGWASAYCAPARAAFRSFARDSPSGVLAGASRRAVAAMGVLLSRHCPVWAGAGGRLRLMQRLGYVSCVAYPLASIPLTAYCAIPAACLLSGKSVFPDDLGYYDAVLLILLLASVVATVALELRWSGVALRAWWRDQKLWVVTGTSACLAAVFQGVLRACAGIDVGFSLSESDAETASGSSSSDDDGDARRSVRWSNLLIPPASLLLGNLAGVVVAVSYGVDHGYRSWGPVLVKLALAGWVVAHLQGFLRGLLARRDRAPTIAVLWSVLFVSVLSLLWVNVDSYSAPPSRSSSASQQPVL
ncbi:hypothetical protein U9M48_027085 [Paspalum notatum var. saurae]|uniref:Uncharacterized protein n=1 Tax=Paspalum notatum var. saurae TaxID=547442 RepID=A0AAQ3TS76_PASNO